MRSKTVIAIAASLLIAGFAGEALAAKKSTSTGTPTAAQRKAMFEAGLKSCRKKYGAKLHKVQVEKFYGRWGAVCYYY